ncbi:hypothetical protein BCR34DRAFT_588343 [Clohesyomyces aquaticus]|uniref:Uncharacterized protein n=1 Tax=Clohesyomyces aquaticus TaxID=1231657 RepID=A0A1Y1ZKL9_9PLEO|nr:hypothetical protein BCR34DRAFT_588343 [Clohesyomyces aquaticus]
MTRNAVFQGFWINRYRNFPNAWILTLSDGWALIFQLAFGLYILYAGDRLWACLRRWSIQGIHLSDIADTIEPPEDGDNLELQPRSSDDDIDNPVPSAQEQTGSRRLRDADFSMGEAIEAFIGLGQSNPRVQMLRDECTPRLLRKIASTAVLVCLLMIVLAPLLPWLLSERGNKRPLVVSKYTPDCGAGPLAPISIQALAYRISASNAERLFLRCSAQEKRPTMDKITEQCPEDALAGPLPPIKYRQVECPFSPGSCPRNHSGLTLDRYLRPTVLGYNSISPLTLQHRLACAPLNLTRYTIPTSKFSDQHVAALMAFHSPYKDLDEGAIMNYMSSTHTLNGPNQASSDFSGWDGSYFNANWGRNMEYIMLPAELPTNVSEFEDISPRLYHKDGTSFVFLFYPGKTVFHPGFYLDTGKITDPIFSATRNFGRVTLLPDHEATALACVEKYRFCYSFSRCSSWIPSLLDDFFTESNSGLHLSPRLGGNRAYLTEEFTKHRHLLALYQSLYKHSSVARYLSCNPKFILAESGHNGRLAFMIHETKQWQHEVRAWFQTAYILARSELHESIVKFRGHDNTRPALENNRKFCSSLLFYDSDYTNFNAFGFTLFISVVSIPIIWDWSTKHTPWTEWWSLARMLPEKIQDWCNFISLILQMIFLLGKDLVSMPFLFASRRFPSPASFLRDAARPVSPSAQASIV